MDVDFARQLEDEDEDDSKKKRKKPRWLHDKDGKRGEPLKETAFDD